ncbi:hypothetical protein FPQ18DRAFT_305417 [Pyronema domesticum]|nr:hypothetical protein FPQ18DRAFT_305417 [Pyronema domesticum]
MAFRHRQSDRIFEWTTGMSIKDATLNFQKCVAENNQSSFGETNADIGGIGVTTSLNIISVSCTLGSCVVMALGFTFERYFDANSTTKSRFHRALIRIWDAITNPMRSFLDAALFLALAMQLAAVIWTAKIVKLLMSDNVTDQTLEEFDKTFKDAFGSGPGGSLYSIYLLLYTSIISTCPTLTLISTPYLWKGINHREFRLMLLAILMFIAAMINLLWSYALEGSGKLTLEYRDRHAGNTTEVECVPAFMFDIMPGRAEKYILRSSWAMCFLGLLGTIILQWRHNWRTMRRWHQFRLGLIGRNIRPFFRKIFGLVGRFFKYLFRIAFSGPAPEGQRSAEAPEIAVIGSDTEAQASKPKFWSKDHRFRPHIRRLLYTIYGLIYVVIQILPLYLLWRIHWLRRHIRTILKDPTPETILYRPFANATKVLEEERQSWDLDNWSFGQILAMSLWFPALLEAGYISIAGEEKNPEEAVAAAKLESNMETKGGRVSQREN